MDKKGTFSFKAVLILLLVIPMTAVLIILGLVSRTIATVSLEKNIKEELRVASYSLREYYIFDIINGLNLDNGFCEYNTDYIDRMAKTGVMSMLMAPMQKAHGRKLVENGTISMRAEPCRPDG